MRYLMLGLLALLLGACGLFRFEPDQWDWSASSTAPPLVPPPLDTPVVPSPDPAASGYNATWTPRPPHAEETPYEEALNSILLSEHYGPYPSLTLAGMELTALPPEINRLYNLEVLILANNQLTSLPPEVGQLRSLRYLDISNNDFTTLPLFLLEMPSLETLIVERNQLTTLDAGFAQIPSLRIACNAFTSLPPELERIIIAQENALASHWGGILPCAGYAGPMNNYQPVGATPTATFTPGP